MNEPDKYFDAEGDIDLNAFTPSDFERFLMSRVNDSQKQLKVGTLSGYRSAIKDLYR
jgi:hypothetical protein